MKLHHHKSLTAIGMLHDVVQNLIETPLKSLKNSWLAHYSSPNDINVRVGHIVSLTVIEIDPDARESIVFSYILLGSLDGIPN